MPGIGRRQQWMRLARRNQLAPAARVRRYLKRSRGANSGHDALELKRILYVSSGGPWRAARALHLRSSILCTKTCQSVPKNTGIAIHSSERVSERCRTLTESGSGVEPVRQGRRPRRSVSSEDQHWMSPESVFTLTKVSEMAVVHVKGRREKYYADRPGHLCRYGHWEKRGIQSLIRSSHRTVQQSPAQELGGEVLGGGFRNNCSIRPHCGQSISWNSSIG